METTTFRLLRLGEVEHLTGLKRSSIYEDPALTAAKVALRGQRCAVWRSDLVDQWLLDQVSQRADGGAA